MKNLSIILIVAIASIFLSACNGGEVEEPDPTDTTGFIEYTIDGGLTQRYENKGEDCSATTVYSDGILVGTSISGGVGVNTIVINDYFAAAAGTYSITTDLAESEIYIITLNNGGTPYALYWGDGISDETGGGIITYTVFEPDVTQAHVEGTFSFTLYDLSENPHVIEGSFAF